MNILLGKYKLVWQSWWRGMKDNRGLSLIEVLVAAFIIVLLVAGVVGVSVASQRMLLNSERQIVALNIINERMELVRSLVYDDVVIAVDGVLPSVEEQVVRNNQEYALITNISFIDDLFTADTNDYKEMEIIVEWEAPNGTTRDLSVVMYITDYEKPKTCTSCELGLCDLTTGICEISELLDAVLIEDSFTEESDLELSLHTPSNGGGWEKIIGDETLEVKSSSGELKGVGCSSGDGALYQSVDEMSGADYSISVNYAGGSSVGGYNVLAARIQDVNNMYALKWNSKNTEDTSGIYKREDGVWTLLELLTGSLDIGSIVALKAEGNTISMLVDDVEIIFVDDYSYLLPGRVGVGMGAVILEGDTCSSQQLDDLNVSLTGGGVSCIPGLFCSNGSRCPISGVCTVDTTILDMPINVGLDNDSSEWCRLGSVCSSGALCPLSGSCPVQSCLDNTCPSGNACFSGFCYPWEWYNVMFQTDSTGGPSDSVAMECKDDVCSDTTDCPGNCSSDCQLIESEGFTGCGRWEAVKECRQTWIPGCQNVTVGGASGSCRGGYDGGGSCADVECLPVVCPAPDLTGRSWCANGEECNISSSNNLCTLDTQCPTGEMCDTGLGVCRTICPDGAQCNAYEGGWAKGCSSKAIVAGPSDCVTGAGGSCSGSAGTCSKEAEPSTIVVSIDNVNADNTQVLSNPVEVLEGDDATLTDIFFRVSLSVSPLDTLMVIVDPVDGSATIADNDYVGIRQVLIFEPGDPLEQVITYKIRGDSVEESDENFKAVIVGVSSAAQPIGIHSEHAEVVIVE